MIAPKISMPDDWNEEQVEFAQHVITSFIGGLKTMDAFEDSRAMVERAFEIWRQSKDDVDQLIEQFNELADLWGDDAKRSSTLHIAKRLAALSISAMVIAVACNTVAKS